MDGGHREVGEEWTQKVKVKVLVTGKYMRYLNTEKCF